VKSVVKKPKKNQKYFGLCDTSHFLCTYTGEDMNISQLLLRPFSCLPIEIPKSKIENLDQALHQGEFCPFSTRIKVNQGKN
jgi:hypothetical protein